MFSGLVEDLGTVEDLKLVSGGAKLRLRSNLKDLKIGDSVAVNGGVPDIGEF